MDQNEPQSRTHQETQQNQANNEEKEMKEESQRKVINEAKSILPISKEKLAEITRVNNLLVLNNIV
jgi:hypothetical protein